MAMADAFGFRLTLAGNDLIVDDNGDPWGMFRRADLSTPARAAGYAGQYECPEFAEAWNVTADNDRLRVEHLPDDAFAPVLPSVYTAGATTLRFTITAGGTPSRMTVDSARTTGFSFSPSQ